MNVETRMRTYVLALLIFACVLATLFIYHGFRVSNVWALVALAVLSAVAEESRVRLSPNIEISISILPTLFAAVVLGPLGAMIVAAASMALELRRNRMKWAVYTLIESITGGLTGLAVVGAAVFAPNTFAAIIFATLAGAVTSQIVDGVFCCLTVRLRKVARAIDVARATAPIMLASLPLYVPVVALLAYAYREASAWSLPLFLVPALAAQRLFVLYQEQRRLTSDLADANQQLLSANTSFAASLVAALEARDEYTAGHSTAVAGYAEKIARRLGLGEGEVRLAHVAGLVHDVGKIALPPGLLEKDTALSLVERQEMERHSEIGERIVAKIENYAEIALVVRHHHERVDGMGYPDRLAGDDIPLLSRIIAVADAYDAMTSTRPYRAAMASWVARGRLVQGAGKQFDMSVVAAFEGWLAEAAEKSETSRAAHPAARGSLRPGRVVGPALA